MNTETSCFCAAMRAVADFFEKHPEIPTPEIPYLIKCNMEAESLRAMAAVSSIHKEKEYSGDSFYLRAEIPYTADGITGTIRVSFHGERAKVCKRKVVGTRDVPEEYVPGYTRAKHTEEIVEWECEPLLAPTEAEETTETASESTT